MRKHGTQIKTKPKENNNFHREINVEDNLVDPLFI